MKGIVPRNKPRLATVAAICGGLTLGGLSPWAIAATTFFFDDISGFDTEIAARNLTPAGPDPEDFESSNVADGDGPDYGPYVDPLSTAPLDPLFPGSPPPDLTIPHNQHCCIAALSGNIEPGVPNPIFPGGSKPELGITYQDNRSTDNPFTPENERGATPQPTLRTDADPRGLAVGPPNVYWALNHQVSTAKETFGFDVSVCLPGKRVVGVALDPLFFDFQLAVQPNVLPFFFNSAARFKFTGPYPGRMTIKVFDASNQLIGETTGDQIKQYNYLDPDDYEIFSNDNLLSEVVLSELEPELDIPNLPADFLSFPDLVKRVGIVVSPGQQIARINITPGLSHLGQIGNFVGADNIQVFTEAGPSAPCPPKAQTLAASPGAVDAAFGEALAQSGSLFVAGAPGTAAAPNSGSVHLYQRASPWAEVARLTADDPTANAQLGAAVDIEGTRVIAGAPKALNGGSDTGAAYVFEPNQTAVWVQQAKLLASDGAAGDLMGASVTVAGDTAAVGAPAADGQGAVYVFTRSGAVWTEQAKLTGSDSGLGDAFGEAVALYQNTLVVGAGGHDLPGAPDVGAAYVFNRSGSNWSETTKLLAPSAGDGNPTDAAGDRLGGAVAIHGNAIVVGSAFDDDTPADAGAAHVFAKVQGTWNHEAKLAAGDAAANDHFGHAVDIDEDAAVIGADGKNGGAGAAYLFIRNGTLWVERSKLTSIFPAAGEQYGHAVAIDEDTVLASANLDNGVADSGVPFPPRVAALKAGRATANRFDCGFGRSYPAESWSQIGLPCRPIAGADTVADLIADDLSGLTYDADYLLYRWDAVARRYVKLALSDSLVPGQGYWLRVINGGFVAPWGGTPTIPKRSGQCPAQNGCFEISLEPGFNLVSHPFPFTVNLADVRVVDGGTVYTLSEASQNNVMQKIIYKWTGSNYATFDDVTPGMEGALHANEGFWVDVTVARTIKLLIPGSASTALPGGSASSARLPLSPHQAPASLWATLVNWVFPAASAAEVKPDGSWYVRLIAEAPSADLRDANNVLGQLPGALRGFDTSDLPELPAFSDFITVVFPHPDWQGHAGDYASDFHPPRSVDRWVFEVRSNRAGREVVLSWDGPESIMNNSFLYDLVTGRRVRARYGSYRFVMDGTVRRLMWFTVRRGHSPVRSSLH